MLGPLIMVVVLVVVLPVAFLIGGAILAAVFGQTFSSTKQKEYEGTELGDLLERRVDVLDLEVDRPRGR